MNIKQFSLILPKVIARLFLSQKVVFKGKMYNKEIFLTFDDGPDPEFTPKLLDLLARYKANATFFVVGGKIKNNEDLLERLIKEGHLLANHSYSHNPKLHEFNPHDIRLDLDKTESALIKIDNITNHLVRAPWGKISFNWLKTILASQTKLIHWSYDSHDYKKAGKEDIIERFAAAPVTAGEIILFHDDNEYTIEALEYLVPLWQSQGYCLNSMKGF